MGSRIVHYFLFRNLFLGDFLYNQRCYQSRSGLQALLEFLFYNLSLDFVTKKREKQLNGVLQAARTSLVKYYFRSESILITRCISLLMKSNYYVLPCRVLPEDIHKSIAIVVINPLTITVVKATTVSVLTYTRIARQGHASSYVMTVSSYTVMICG